MYPRSPRAGPKEEIVQTLSQKGIWVSQLTKWTLNALIDKKWVVKNTAGYNLGPAAISAAAEPQLQFTLNPAMKITQWNSSSPLIDKNSQ